MVDAWRAEAAPFVRYRDNAQTLSGKDSASRVRDFSAICQRSGGCRGLRSGLPLGVSCPTHPSMRNHSPVDGEVDSDNKYAQDYLNGAGQRCRI